MLEISRWVVDFFLTKERERERVNKTKFPPVQQTYEQILLFYVQFLWSFEGWKSHNARKEERRRSIYLSSGKCLRRLLNKDEMLVESLDGFFLSSASI